MDNNLIEHIISDIRYFGKSVVLVENPDGFLLRADVIKRLNSNNIYINQSSRIQQRIAFELRDKNDYSKILILITNDYSSYLDDVQQKSAKFSFRLSNYIDGYHIETILKFDLILLDKLYKQNQIIPLSKKDTEEYALSLSKKDNNSSKFDLVKFQNEIDELLKVNLKDWYQIIKVISEAILETINTELIDKVITLSNSVNQLFQTELEINYEQSINSNPIKKPKIVSKILDHLSYTSLDKKIALIVVDGMSFWQYQLIQNKFPSHFRCIDDFTYSIIPSITQLSRQAIFRGSTPKKDYSQNPTNEAKLWKEYWASKGINKTEIRYNHEIIDLSATERISKFALVFKDLDEKMHSSSDYEDLKGLTENWVERSKIIQIISQLLASGFEIYLTTDHGNIEAKGWRRLNGREKLGTNKSGSKSQRHIEYSESKLAEQFMESNEGINYSLIKKDNLLYFKDNLSFSPKDQLVTHGGSHILEVLIPFIKITK